MGLRLTLILRVPLHVRHAGEPVEGCSDTNLWRRAYYIGLLRFNDPKNLRHLLTLRIREGPDPCYGGSMDCLPVKNISFCCVASILRLKKSPARTNSSILRRLFPLCCACRRAMPLGTTKQHTGSPEDRLPFYMSTVYYIYICVCGNIGNICTSITCIYIYTQLYCTTIYIYIQLYIYIYLCRATPCYSRNGSLAARRGVTRIRGKGNRWVTKDRVEGHGMSWEFFIASEHAQASLTPDYGSRPCHHQWQEP